MTENMTEIVPKMIAQRKEGILHDTWYRMVSCICNDAPERI